MKNILNKIKINNFTYILLFLCLLAGMFKNVIIIFLIILVHELGHVFFIKTFNYHIKKIEIYPFGGITKIEKDLNDPLIHDLIISIGGFIFQIILYIIVYFLYDLGILSEITLNIFRTYNKAIFLFNILPIIPLDGYILLKSFLELFLSFKKAYIVMTIISFLGIVFYFYINFVYCLNNYMIITLLLYKTFICFKEINYIYNKFLLERYLNIYPYKKTRQERKISLQNFKRETLHFFKVGDKYVHERVILKKKFDKNRHF